MRTAAPPTRIVTGRWGTGTSMNWRQPRWASMRVSRAISRIAVAEVGRPSGTERNMGPSAGASAGRMSMRARTRAMEPRSPAEP